MDPLNNGELERLDVRDVLVVWPTMADFGSKCVGASIPILPWVNYIWAERSRGGELESAIATAEPVGFIELELEMCRFSYLCTSGA